MKTQKSAHKPIFVIGSYRSGTSVFTWCLGQHPNILPLPETNWIARLTVDLHHLYRLGTINGRFSHLGSLGWDVDEFFAQFGKAVDQFIVDTKEPRLRQIAKLEANSHATLHDTGVGEPNASAAIHLSPAPGLLSAENYRICRSENDPKTRWVDGTPENTHYAYGLSRLFPQARFIHLLRNPHDVARSLMGFSRAGAAGRDYTQEEAYNAWLGLVQSAVRAEWALGSETVVRIRYEDLVDQPEAILRKCLRFLGESYDEHCLRPLNERINSSRIEGLARDVKDIDLGPDTAAGNAHRLYERLLSEHIDSLSPDSEIIDEFRNLFLQYVADQSNV
jgi:hypothetical protein